jgi:hypothetical protein
MANEEEKDGLFSINLGEDLIEVDDQKETKVEKPEDTTKKPEEKKVVEPGVPEIYDDGSFEVDEGLQKAIDTTVKAEEDGTIIEKTEKQTEDKGKAPSDSDSSSDSSPSSSPYLAFAKDQAKEGVFLDFSDEQWAVLVERNEGSESAALRELSAISQSEMIKSGIERYKDSLTPEEKALYEAKEKGIPVDQYGIAKHNYDKWSKVDKDTLKENVKLQEDVVTEVLTLRGFSQEEIKEEIEGYKALENLEAKAEKALPLIPDVYKKRIESLETKAAAEEQSRKDKIAQRVSKMKKMVDTVPEIIPGIKLTKPTREKILSSMTTPIARDAQGNPLNPVMATRAKNPEAFEMMIHYYHGLGLFDIEDDGSLKPDFSKIANIEKTKATDELRDIFESKEKPISGKSPKVKTEDDDMSDFENAFRRL